MITLNLIGTIGKDSESKEVTNLGIIHNFSVACRKGKETIWVDATLSDKMGSKLSQYLLKGTKVFISGTPSVHAYINKSNQTVGQLKIWVNNLELLGSTGSESNAETPENKHKSDEIPF